MNIKPKDIKPRVAKNKNGYWDVVQPAGKDTPQPLFEVAARLARKLVREQGR